MNRSILFAAAFIACLSIGAATVATATPPKKSTERTATPTGSATGGQASKEQAATPRLSPATVWFGFVSQIEVSVKQQDEITPLIRNYLANLEKWSKGGAVKMKSLMDKAKGSDDAERKALMMQARELRKSMPRYDRVKKKVSDLLTHLEKVRLAELIRENKGSPQNSLTPSTGKGQGADGKSVKGDSEAAKKSVKANSGPPLWSFKNDLDPKRHATPKSPAVPEKGGASKSGEGSGS